MKRYFLIAGEASGDLHGSNLMRELKTADPQADFRFLGGDLMAQAGGAPPLVHYRQMAFMGFLNVLKNARTVLKNIRLCKQKIAEYQPDILVLIDYPSFNLRIAKFVKKALPATKIVYYISPKIWAWKTFRIRQIKRYIDKMYCILPFETDFYRKFDFRAEYVGNPSVDSVAAFKPQYTEKEFVTKFSLQEKPIIALLAGSRRQEIAACLPAMFEAADYFTEFQTVVAGAPSIEQAFYHKIVPNKNLQILSDNTYELLAHARLAIVNSGTATLETALLGVPQIVVYQVAFGKLALIAKRLFIKVPFVSLVNLIAGKQAVKELIASDFTAANIRAAMPPLLFDTAARRTMLADYAHISHTLGEAGAARCAAEKIAQI